jgi:hypothetical protein
MMTSNTSSLSDEVAAAPVCGKEEDVPATRLIVVPEPPTAVTSAAEPVSGTGGAIIVCRSYH